MAEVAKSNDRSMSLKVSSDAVLSDARSNTRIREASVKSLNICEEESKHPSFLFHTVFSI